MMEKIVHMLDEKVSPWLNQLADQPSLKMIRDALGAITPILMVGSFFVLVVKFPQQNYQMMLTQAYDGMLLRGLQLPITFSYEMLALYLVISFALQISKQKNEDPFPVIIIAMTGYLILTFHDSIQIFSARNSLFAAIVSITVSKSYILLRTHLKEIKESIVPPAVLQTLKNLWPYVAIVVSCSVIRMGAMIVGIDLLSYFNATILAFLETLILNYWFMLLLVFMVQFVWFFGLHGSRLVFSMFDLILVPAMEINRLAFMEGKALPQVISKQFFDVFVSAGGTAIFGLILVLWLSKRTSAYHEIGKHTMWPACFNISEPIVFSLPIVLNQYLLIPYLVAPMVCASLTYWAMISGYVQPPIGIVIPWFIPSFIAGYLATLDVNAILLQGVNIGVAMLIYTPFVIKMRRNS